LSLEFDMHGQDTIQVISKEEDGVGLKPLAAINPASATAVAAAPVNCPKGLPGRLYSPPNGPLFVN
jgi:hypothetical protein